MIISDLLFIFMKIMFNKVLFRFHSNKKEIESNLSISYADYCMKELNSKKVNYL